MWCFRTPDLQQSVPQKDSRGVPQPRTGAAAAVFKLERSGVAGALKVFKFGLDQRRRRYQAIADHLSRMRSPHLVDFTYEEEGIRVPRGSESFAQARWFPIVRMPWVEGLTLNRWVERQLSRGDAAAARAFASRFAAMIWELKSHGVAHGNLCDANVLAVGDEPVLVDYDGTYVPALANDGPNEYGLPGFEHPLRQQQRWWGPHLDDFSAWVIWITLRAVAADPWLWRRHDVARSDTMLFSPQDLEAPEQSRVWPELLRSSDKEVAARAEALFRSLKPPFAVPPFDVGDQPSRRPQTSTPAASSSVQFRRYKQQICRKTPGCVIFLLDQSDSMNDGVAGSKRSKAEALATTVNRFITDLITECLKGEPTPRHYFDLALIGCRTDAEGRHVVGPAFQGPLEGRDVVSVVDLFNYPLKEVVKEVDDGEGGLITRRSYVWYEKVAEGGAPMTHGLDRCTMTAINWISAHPDSFPPIVINVTDGEPTDGDPELAAETLRGLATSDGEVLLFNCHLSDKPTVGVLFPDNESQLPDDFARMLFRMSSPLPERSLSIAAGKGFEVSPGARGMVFNGDATAMIQLVPVGTVLERRLR
jgi:hypothetical protein